MTAVVCAMFMPETMGKSLDEIEDAFRGKNVEGGKGINFKTAIRRAAGRTSA